jgi:hypothetical protein
VSLATHLVGNVSVVFPVTDPKAADAVERALGSTVPYCDMVVTDKAIAHHARQTGLADRLGTVVTAQLTEVVDFVS